MKSKKKDMHKIFHDKGETLVVGCNSPIILADPSYAWYLETGDMHIFLVELEDGRPSSSRYYLFDIKPGEMFFGMDLSDIADDMILIAVGGSPDTTIIQLPRDYIKELGRDHYYTCAVADAIDTWIIHLASLMPRPIPRKDSTLLKQSEVGKLSKGNIIIPKRGVIWVSFGAKEELKSPIPSDAFMPITRNNWLEVHSDTEFYSVDTTMLFDLDPDWGCIDEYHKLILMGISTMRYILADRECDLLKKKASLNYKTFQNACLNLVGVLDKDVAGRYAVKEVREVALFKACGLVADAMNIKLTFPKEQEAVGDVDAILNVISKISRVRIRAVTLNGEWWKSDCGPLLAFVGEDKCPVALIQKTAESYDIVDPVTGERRPVDGESVRILDVRAYMFYRPLPERELGFRDIFKYIWQSKSGVSVNMLHMILIGFAGGFLGLLVPIFTGIIFNNIIPEAQKGQLFQIVAALIIVATAMGIFQLTQGFMMLRITEKGGAPLEAAMWDRILSLPVSFFKKFSSGDLAVRAFRIMEIKEALSGMGMRSLLMIIFSSFNLVLLFYYDSSLALWAVGLVIISLFMTAVIYAMFLKYQYVIVEMESRMQGLVLQLLTGIAKIRVAGVELNAFEVWASKFSKQCTVNFKAGSLNNVAMVLFASFPTFSSIVIFAKLGIFTENPMSAGTFLAFNAAFGTFMASIAMLGPFLNSVLTVIPHWKQMQPIFETVPEVSEGKESPGELSGRLSVEHLCFRYSRDAPMVLNDMSFDIKPGEYIGIVGPSGSGKSTLLRLLLGFEDLSSGSINWDGRDMSVLDVAKIRRQLGVVLQSSRIMIGSLFSNIVGTASLTMDDAWKAAEMAGLADDIREMPMGMHTMVSEGAGTFSGGQKQRLMIARAIVNRPRILLFDEATSALDNRTQAHVIGSLDMLQATRVVIAHRLSTIINVDRILVIDKGVLQQEGTFEELAGKPGVFADLIKRQQI